MDNLHTVISSLEKLTTLPKEATAQFQELYTKNQGVFAQLLSVAQNREFNKQLRNSALLILNRLLCKKFKNMKPIEFLDMPKYLNILQSIIYDNFLFTYRQKLLLSHAFAQLISTQTLKLQDLKRMIKKIVEREINGSMILLAEAVCQSYKMNQLDKLNISCDLIGKLCEQGYQLLKQIETIVQNLSKNVNDCSIRQKYQEKLKYTVQISEQLNKIFHKFLRSSQQYDNKMYRNQMVSKCLKNSHFGHFVIKAIYFNVPNQYSTKIVCTKTIDQLYYDQINQIKDNVFKTYVELLILTDQEFNLEDSPLQIYNEIPNLIYEILNQLSKIAQFYHILFTDPDAFLIEIVITRMYRFLTLAFRLKELYKIYHNIPLQQIHRITIPYLAQNSNQVQMFQSQPSSYDQLLSRLKDQQLSDGYLKYAVCNFIQIMAKQVDGFLSAFFNTCSEIIEDQLTKNNRYIQNKQKIRNWNEIGMESAILGLSSISKMIYKRTDLIQRIQKLHQKINLDYLSQIALHHWYQFLIHSFLIFKLEHLQREIFYIFTINEESDSLLLKALQFLKVFLFEYFCENIQLHSPNPNDDNYQPSKRIKIGFQENILAKIPEMKSLSYFSFILQMFEILKKNIFILYPNTKDICELIKTLVQRLLLVYSSKNPILFQAFAIIKILITVAQQRICTEIYDYVITSIYRWDLIKLRQKEQIDELLTLFATLTWSSPVVSPQAKQVVFFCLFQQIQPQATQNWYQIMMYFIANQNKLSIQEKQKLFKCCDATLPQHDHPLSRVLLITQLFITMNPDQYRSQQWQKWVQSVLVLLSQIRDSIPGIQPLRKLTIVNLIHVFLFNLHLYKNPMQYLWVIEMAHKNKIAYNKYAANVLLQCFRLYFQSIEELKEELEIPKQQLQIKMKILQPYLNLIIQVLLKLYEKPKTFGQVNDIDINLHERMHTGPLNNCFTASDPFVTFAKIMKKIPYSHEIFSENFTHFLSEKVPTLLQVLDVKGQPRKFMKIANPK